MTRAILTSNLKPFNTKAMLVFHTYAIIAFVAIQLL